VGVCFVEILAPRKEELLEEERPPLDQLAAVAKQAEVEIGL
jgi:hypothetical protein